MASEAPAQGTVTLELVMSASRAYAEEFSWHEPYATISICDPDAPAARLPDRNLVARLNLRFFDLDRDYEDGRIVFTSEMATEVLDFVQKGCRGAKLLLVHCEAGVSRSPALARSLGEVLSVEVRHENAVFLSPNALVLRLMAQRRCSED